MIKIIKKNCAFFLLIFLVLNLISQIWGNISRYKEEYNPEYWEIRYLKSQWVDPNSKELIGDDGLYAYAGWEYLKGRDPTTLNAEMPPLGKYLIGLTILIFKNQNLFGLFSGLLVIFSLYKLSRLILNKSTAALAVVTIFSFEPLFSQQLRAPFLDLLYLTFLLWVFYFFLKNQFIYAGLFLGLMMSTKSAMSTFIIVFFTMVISLTLIKEWVKIRGVIVSGIVSFLVYLLSYLRFFLLGNSLKQFLVVQKWIINFYANGATGKIETIWVMLITGQWITWWDGVIKVDNWWFGWIVLLGGSTILWLKLIYNPRLLKEKILLLAIWVFVYLIFLNFIPVWPRYLLLFLPFGYIILIYLLDLKFFPKLSQKL